MKDYNLTLLERKLLPTKPEYSDFVDAFAYAIAAQMAKLGDEYVFLHIKKCPKWLPTFLYKLILSRVLVLNRFTKYVKYQESVNPNTHL